MELFDSRQQSQWIGHQIGLARIGVTICQNAVPFASEASPVIDLKLSFS